MTEIKQLSERIDALETRLTFQDDTIETSINTIERSPVAADPTNAMAWSSVTRFDGGEKPRA